MVEYIEYKKKQIPFLISFSTLLEFKKRSGKEFVQLFSGHLETTELAEILCLLVELSIKTGYKKVGKSLWDKLFFRLKEEDYINIVDEHYKKLIDLIPKFFYTLQQGADEVSEQAMTELEGKKK